MSEVRTSNRDERGAAAVEYAVVTAAAASLGGALLVGIGWYPHPIGLPKWFLEWIAQLLLWIISLFQGT